MVIVLFRLVILVFSFLVASLIILLAFVRCSMFFFFFSSRRRHTRFDCDWSSDVCSSDLGLGLRRTGEQRQGHGRAQGERSAFRFHGEGFHRGFFIVGKGRCRAQAWRIATRDRKSTRLNSSHSQISYAVFCLKKKKKKNTDNNVAQKKQGVRMSTAATTVEQIANMQSRFASTLKVHRVVPRV